MAGGTAVLFPREDLERGIPARFERIAAAGPDRLAVTAGDRTLTYGELNAAGNRVARAILTRRGAESEPVAVLADHDAAAIAAILGVLKAGKVYLVLDVRHPAARLRTLLAASGAPLIVSGARHLDLARGLATGGPTVLDVDALAPDADTSDPALPLHGRMRASSATRRARRASRRASSGTTAGSCTAPCAT